jgi:hypothetical protein
VDSNPSASPFFPEPLFADPALLLLLLFLSLMSLPSLLSGFWEFLSVAGFRWFKDVRSSAVPSVVLLLLEAEEPLTLALSLSRGR